MLSSILNATPHQNCEICLQPSRFPAKLKAIIQRLSVCNLHIFGIGRKDNVHAWPSASIHRGPWPVVHVTMNITSGNKYIFSFLAHLNAAIKRHFKYVKILWNFHYKNRHSVHCTFLDGWLTRCLA